MKRAISSATLTRLISKFVELFPDEAAEVSGERSSRELAGLLTSLSIHSAAILAANLPAESVAKALILLEQRRLLELAAEIPAGRKKEILESSDVKTRVQLSKRLEPGDGGDDRLPAPANT